MLVYRVYSNNHIKFIHNHLSFISVCRLKLKATTGALIMHQRLRHLLYTVLGVEENFMLSLSTFFFFETTKKAFKSYLDLYFHPLIIEFFDVPSYSSELRKRYTLRLLLVCTKGNFGCCSAWVGQMTCLWERFVWGY